MAWNSSRLFSSWFYGLIFFSGLTWEVLVLVALIHSCICSQLPGRLGAGWSRMASAWLSYLLHWALALQDFRSGCSLGKLLSLQKEREKKWSGPLSLLPHSIGQSREEEEGKKGNRLYILLGEIAQPHYKGCWRSFADHCKYLAVNIYKALSLISWASW